MQLDSGWCILYIILYVIPSVFMFLLVHMYIGTHVHIVTYAEASAWSMAGNVCVLYQAAESQDII